MGGKIASFLATLFLSIPLAAIGLVAIFGIPKDVPASNSGDHASLMQNVRDRFTSWNQSKSADSDFLNAPGYEDATILGQSASLPGAQWPDSHSDSDSHSHSHSDSHSHSHSRAGQSPFSNGPTSDRSNASQLMANSSMSIEAANESSRARSPFGERASSNAFNQSAGIRTAELANSDRQSSFPVSTSAQSGAGSPFDRNSDRAGSPRHQFLDAQESAQQASSAANPPAFYSSSFSGKNLSWKQASLKLADMGIKDYHLEPSDTEGRFLFVCLYSTVDAPQVIHRFEEESEDPLDAVNRVLQKVDSFMQEQFAKSKYPDRNQKLSVNSQSQR